MAVDPVSGSLHISLPLRRQVWAIPAENRQKSGERSIPKDLKSNYIIVVGDGRTCDETSKCGDGGPAELASLAFPKGITFRADRSMFLADGRKIRMISSDKRIETISAPSNVWRPKSCDSDVEASEVRMEWPTALAISPLSQKILVLDSDIVYEMDPTSKTVRVVLGMPNGCESLQTGANETVILPKLEEAKSMTANDRGVIFVAEFDGKRRNRVRAFDSARAPQLVAGRESKCECDRQNCPCDDEDDKIKVGKEARLYAPTALAFDPSGQLHIADRYNYKVKTVFDRSPEWNEHSRVYRVVSADTDEVYFFNAFGQHVATRSLLSGLFTYNFTYHIDSVYGRLTHVTGGGDYRLYFVRKPTEVQIETLQSLTTILEFGSDRMLNKVISPDSGLIKLEYDREKKGLLSTKVLGDGRTWFFEYDYDGRAKSMVDPIGTKYEIIGGSVGSDVALFKVAKNGQRFAEFGHARLELTASGNFLVI